MSKYSFEEKFEAVRRVVEDGMSSYNSARILGTSHSVVQRWCQLYQQYGSQALLNGGATYDGEFKVKVVEYMHNNNLSAWYTSFKFGIKGVYSVYKWERIYYEEGPEGLLKPSHRGRTPKGIQEMKSKPKKLPEQTEKDLIAEIQHLRMENEYLKKLNALVQERIARENGKEPPSSTN